MALTDHKDRKTENLHMRRPPRWYNVPASTTFYRGSMVFMNTTTGVIGKTPGAGTRFVGIAVDGYANTTGSATTNTPLLVENGQCEQMTLAGVALQNVGASVYGDTDDSALNLTKGANGNLVGIIYKIVTGTTILVEVTGNVGVN